MHESEPIHTRYNAINGMSAKQKGNLVFICIRLESKIPLQMQHKHRPIFERTPDGMYCNTSSGFDDMEKIMDLAGWAVTLYEEEKAQRRENLSLMDFVLDYYGPTIRSVNALATARVKEITKFSAYLRLKPRPIADECV